RSKISNDHINDQDVDEEENKLRACRNTDSQHCAPDFELSAPFRKSKTEVMIFFFEVPKDQDIREEYRNKGRDRRARDAQMGQRYETGDDTTDEIQDRPRLAPVN